MSQKYFFGSITRRSDLATEPFEVEPLARSDWEEGDFVVGEVTQPHTPLARVELPTGRMIDLVGGDLMVGAFGTRQATLEAVGDWHDIGPDGDMEAMTSAGLFGRVSFSSFFLPSLMSLRYCGHVVRGGRKVVMSDFVPEVAPNPHDTPTVLIIGTSMSAGKTTAAKVIVRQLKQAGLCVVGAKLTGAARYRDTLAMRDAGADAIYDFVDVGLPSSIGPPDQFRRSLSTLLSLIAAEEPDVVVAEAGASPLEPYNGSVVLEMMAEQVKFTLLCALDPYAVVGAVRAFGMQPDLVAGVATTTSAGIDLVEELSGLPALNLLDPRAWPELHKRLGSALDF